MGPQGDLRQPGVAQSRLRLGRGSGGGSRRASTLPSWWARTPREIVFTSGATESDNLAIKGVAHFNQKKGKHIVTCKTEHKAVLDSCRQLEREGYEVTYLDPEPNGLIDLDKLKAALRDDTSLVSIMHVNNEIGVIQDIEAIGALCRERKIVFHVDAAQSAGQSADRPERTAGRPDELFGAQDLRPQRHRRAVRAAQTADTAGSPDARWRPRTRHALGHAGDPPDRRHGRSLPHRRGRKWQWKTNAC